MQGVVDTIRGGEIPFFAQIAVGARNGVVLAPEGDECGSGGNVLGVEDRGSEVNGLLR